MSGCGGCLARLGNAVQWSTATAPPFNFEKGSSITHYFYLPTFLSSFSVAGAEVLHFGAALQRESSPRYQFQEKNAIFDGH